MNWIYEPKALSDFVIADKDAAITLDLILSGKLPFPASGKNGLLFYGPPGTGKSALAEFVRRHIPIRLKANPLDCSDKLRSTYDLPHHQADYEVFIERCYHFLNSSDALLVAQRPWPGAPNPFIVLFENAHSLNEKRTDQLCAIMQRFSSHVFLYTTHRPQLIDSALKSRCHLIGMPVAPATEWLPIAKKVIAAEGLPELKDEVLLPLIASCKGDARSILNACFREALVRSDQKANNEAA